MFISNSFQIATYREGKIHGNFMNVAGDASVVAKGKMINGKLEGKMTRTWANGTIDTATYKDGEKI